MALGALAVEFESVGGDVKLIGGFELLGELVDFGFDVLGVDVGDGAARFADEVVMVIGGEFVVEDGVVLEGI